MLIVASARGMSLISGPFFRLAPALSRIQTVIFMLKLQSIAWWMDSGGPSKIQRLSSCQRGFEAFGDARARLYSYDSRFFITGG
jgi:hypothetical protein